MSIATENGNANGRSGLRMLVRRRFVPLWLFAFSLITAALLSLSYWGYLTPPSSTISAVKSVDHIALVRFDEDYALSVIPLDDMPYLITPDFPPSQILPSIPAELTISKTLDPALAQDLSTALAREGVDIGVHRIEYSPEPVINPNGCGLSCFHPGVQPQADGSLLVIYPELNLEGQPPFEGTSQRVTPNEWWYYSFITPAGYVVQGQDAEGTHLVFTAIASGGISGAGGDHYRYHELTFTQEPEGLSLRNHLSYNFDISGLEGFNVAVMTMSLFVPLLLLWFAFLLVSALMAFLRRRTARRHSIA